ncbi:cellulose binding domain-containing protein [Ruminococcus sp. RTP21204st1_B2_RTP21204_210225]|jgi:hypothetical protein|uniref:cellulose binding domain-containing protein n=1 Tax=Ruminococcus TaxID=1263 RepID=UPI0034A5BBB8
MKRRIISFLLSFVIAFVFILPANVLAAEENAKKYYGTGYEITYDIKSQWTGNQNVEVTVKNTGTEPLLNWSLKYDAHGEINGLWNGTVLSSDSTKYIIKNAGYNYEIKPEQSVTFGYTLSGEYMEFPETIELCSQRTERDSEGYSVTMDITDDWDIGFIGTVTIENLSENPLEAWRLSFNTNFDIEDIWNTQILSSFENSYTVANDITTTPIGVGESKTFGFKATKESGVTPEMTDFVMSEITVNEDFTTIDIPEIILAVSGFANYIEEENALNIFWYTNIEDGRFELLESYNNEDFITTVILNNEYSYTYPITMDFDKRYFKVIQTTDDGQTAESPVFYVEKTEDGYSSKFIDSDEDGLPDFVEKQIGTDINNEDTDSDGLTDYQEYYILGTDPLVYDSVTEGVSDADADSDDDGLSNIKEFELGTKPFNPDTDNDGLTDGDEVNIYGTDPLKYDTDDDGISDGDEVALGTDPLSPTTDGIADTERTFVQTIDADDEILEDINTEYNPYDLSLEITAAGNAQSSLTVQESGYSDSMFNWSILGTCPELNYDDSCKVDEVVLKFKVDEEYIDNPDSEYAEENPEFAGIKRYNVFRFFEEDNILLPVKTDVDVENNTVSATVSDLGTYCLIDMECFLQDIVQGAEDFENENSEKTENEELPTLQTFSLFAARTLSAAAETAEISEAEPDKKVKPAIKYTDEFNIVFMYDSRDCTSDEDYAYFYENICDTAEFIFNQSPNANVYLLEMENASADLSYSAGSDRFSEITDGGSKYEIHDLYIFKDNFDETTSEVNLTEEEIEASLKEQSDYGKMTEEEKESYRKTQRQLDMLRNNVVVSDVFDFVLNGIDSEKVVDTDIPTLCFSFFNDKNALYNENTGRDYLSEMKNNDNIFVNLIGSYDFSTYIGGYAYDLYQQTGGKRFNLRDDTLLSERLIKYIYELSESEEIPEIENKYPMILSTGLEYVELDAPITIDYINAYRNITAANHNSSKFSGYADTDEDGLYDFEEINFGYDLIRRENGRVVLPTYGECIDKYSGLFYVEDGLNRFFESAPDYLPTADAQRVLYNTKVLPIRSNPLEEDSDYDGTEDYVELWGTYTNPLTMDGLLPKENIDILTDITLYNSEYYRQRYSDDVLTYGSVAIGNAVFGSTFNYDEIYESVLIDYFASLNDVDMNYRIITEMLDGLKSYKALKKSYKLYKNQSYYKDILDYQALLYRMIKSHKYVKTETLDNLISKYSTLVYDTESKLYGSLNAEKNIFDKFGAIGVNKVNWTQIAIDTLTYVEMCTRFNACEETINNNIDILYEISQNAESSSLKSAADKLILKLESDWAGDIAVAVSDLAYKYVGTITMGAIRTVIASYGPVGYLVDLGLTFTDVVLNISGQCKYAVKTYAAASIASVLNEMLRNDLYGIAYDDKYYKIIAVEAPINYYRLIYARLYAEQMYIDFRDEAPDFIKCIFYSDDITNSRIIVNHLRNMISVEE